MEIFEWILVLLVSAVLLAALARRLNLPYPSLLALGGTTLALLPYAPEFTLDPALTLALFVAPVLLDAAFDTSLRDLKRFWIPVLGLVVIAVGITILAVACLVHWMVPDLPWAAAVALGAIVAPPDAAAASAILRQLNIPHRMVVILEGESLLNDATALLVYRLAVTATLGEPFTSASIAPQALAMLASVAAGFVLAHLVTRLLALIGDISSTIIMQFVGAFGVWILAEHLGLSAIVSVVVFGITSARIVRTPAHIRLPSYAVWTTAVFLLNVLAFVLIGLQLRPILAGLEAGERTQYLQIAAAVLGVVIAVRIAWVMLYNRLAWLKARLFGAGYWPGPYQPTLAGSLVVSWCGMRGIVTLATAYALPENFPHRDLMLVCAFGVVVGTLILQGLTLRPLILALGLTSDCAVETEVKAAQEALARIAASIIDGDESETARVLRDEFIVIPAEDGTPSIRQARNEMRSRIIAAQRAELTRLRDDSVIGDDAFHLIEEKLDRFEVTVS